MTHPITLPSSHPRSGLFVAQVANPQERRKALWVRSTNECDFIATERVLGEVNDCQKKGLLMMSTNECDLTATERARGEIEK